MMDRNELLKVMKKNTQYFEKYEEGLKGVESGSDDIKFVISIDSDLIEYEELDLFEKELSDILKSLNVDTVMDWSDGFIEMKGSLKHFEDFRILVYTIDYFMKNHRHETSHLMYDWVYMDSCFSFESDGTLRISYYENWTD